MAPKAFSALTLCKSEQRLGAKLSPHLLTTPWRQELPPTLLFLSVGAPGEVLGPYPQGEA